MVVTIFRSRLRPGCEAAYEELAPRILELARGMPGFVGIKTFTADDGERVSLVEFDTPEAQAAWRDHPEHVRAQARGRAEFYAEYHIQVCSVERQVSYPRKGP